MSLYYMMLKSNSARNCLFPCYEWNPDFHALSNLKTCMHSCTVIWLNMHNRREKYAVLKFSSTLCYIFYFFLKQHTTNFSNLSSFKLMHLSDSTFLNIENDPFTSREVIGAFLSEEIWAKVSLYQISLQFPNMLSFLSTFWLVL